VDELLLDRKEPRERAQKGLLVIHLDRFAKRP
jgi:hypothetical protein